MTQQDLMFQNANKQFDEAVAIIEDKIDMYTATILAQLQYLEQCQKLEESYQRVIRLLHNQITVEETRCGNLKKEKVRMDATVFPYCGKNN